MGSVVSGFFGAKAAKQQAKAANNATALEVAAQNRAIAEQRRVGDEVENLFAGYLPQGDDAFNVLSFENGLRSEAPTLSDGSQYGGFELSNDYTFARDEGLNAINNRFAAAGGLNSGALEKARIRFAEGIASQGRNEFLNRLGGFSDTGFAARQATANAKTGAGTNITNLLAQQGATQAAGTIAAGNARAAGTQILGNIPNNLLNENLQVLGATSQAVGNIVGAAGGASSFAALSDERDKTDVAPLDGLDFIRDLEPITFTYDARDGDNPTDGRAPGFMAQALQAVEAKHGDIGLVNGSDETRLTVNYGHLIPVLVAAVQELSAQVEDMRTAA